MKKLMTICAVLCLMSLTCVSWASAVTPPPGAPSWWNNEGELFAYGWWSADIIGTDPIISPPNDPSHWASNYLSNTAFTANIGVTNQTISVNLGNVFRQDLQKQIYVYITGTTNSTVADIIANVDTDSGVFDGRQTWIIQGNVWSFVLSGVIRPQPHFVSIDFNVPGMTGVTNIWAGENCIIPEPATMSLLALGGLAMLRRRFAR